MEITPHAKPIACFGSEYSKQDPKCQACAFVKGCQVAMGIRVNRVVLSKIRFDLLPELLQPSGDKVDGQNIHNLFDTCHDAVFGKPCHYRLAKDGPDKVRAAAELAKCNLRLFITAVMMAHQEANPREPFYPNALFGRSAIRRVDMYRTVCREKFGHFDIGAFEKLRGQSLSATELEERMLTSEVLFGSMVVGHRLYSDSPMFANVYRLRELGFDPVWLAIEDTYRDVLNKDISGEEPTTGVLSTLRFNVLNVKKLLKNNRPKLVETFKIREKIMPTAIQQVLAYHRLNPDHFEIVDEPVKSASAFWSILGKALSGYYCWRAIDGDQQALRRITKE